MGGLQNNNQASALLLTKLYNLFKFKNILQNNNNCCHDWKKIEQLGLPDNKYDDWRYISFNKLLLMDSVISNKFKINPLLCNDISLKLDAYKLVFVAGYLDILLSDKNIGPWKIEINKYPKCEPLVNPIKPDFFLYLTDSLSYENVKISLPSGSIAKKPLYLLYIGKGSVYNNKMNMYHYCHNINIGSGASGHVIEHYVSIKSYENYFTGSHMSFHIEDNAQLHHVKLAFETESYYHLAYNDMIIGNHSVVQSNLFVIYGAKYTRHKTSAKLDNKQSCLSINSLTLPFNKNVYDIQTYLEHNASHGISNQLHRSIGYNQGVGVFGGTIKVNSIADKTNGYIVNNNLLLDNEAQFISSPQLEIHADDVKCGHAATIGCIDINQIFYLCSRGISRYDALKLIICAFSSEIAHLVVNDVICDYILSRINNILRKINI